MLDGFNTDVAIGCLAIIELEPHRWKQAHWADVPFGASEQEVMSAPELCGTSMCMAGHAVNAYGSGINWKSILYGGSNTIAGERIEDEGLKLLGLETEWYYLEEQGHPHRELFHGDNELDDLYEIVADYSGLTEIELRSRVMREMERRHRVEVDALRATLKALQPIPYVVAR
jgi:hypothetical protein